MKSLLWIDSRAGLAVGAFVLILAGPLSALYGLPLPLVVGIGIANLVYGSFSFSLTRMKTRPRGLLWLLIGGNAAWAVVCVVIAWRSAPEASALGTGTLLFEAAFVGALAFLEWRNLESLVAGA